MTTTRIGDMLPNAHYEGTYMVTAAIDGKAKNGKDYIRLTFTDGEGGEATAFLWERTVAQCAEFATIPVVLDLSLNTGVHRNAIVFQLLEMKFPEPGTDLSRFYPAAPEETPMEASAAEAPATEAPVATEQPAMEQPAAEAPKAEEEKAEPEIILFSDMQEGATYSGLYLVKEVAEDKKKDGSPYCKLTIADGEMSVKAKYWSAYEFQDIPGVYMLTVDRRTYNGAPDYNIRDIQPAAPGADVSRYVRKPEIATAEELYGMISTAVHSVTEKTGKTAVTDLFNLIWEKNKDKLIHSSAAKGRHHNRLGGLVEHTWNVVKLVLAQAEMFMPGEVDVEVLAVGAALHDIGKLEEIETDNVGTVTYTKKGDLFGHSYLGAEMLEKEIWSHPDLFGKPELADRFLNLKHILLCHHGRQEWGAAKEPGTLECWIVNSADVMNSTSEAIREAIRPVKDGEASEGVLGFTHGFTHYNHIYRLR